MPDDFRNLLGSIAPMTGSIGHRWPIPKQLRTAVIARDGYVCQLCQQPVQPADVHLDHIKPYSKGGRHTLANLQVTHSRCNLRKGAKYDGEDPGI